MRNFSLQWLHGEYVVCRLAPSAPIPAWAQGELVSISRTPHELSVVCRQDQVPPEVVRAERDWCCLRVAGTLDFSQLGVLAALTAPLAEAGVSVFAVSTYDTDYLLVPSGRASLATDVLQAAGHAFQPPTEDA